MSIVLKYYENVFYDMKCLMLKKSDLKLDLTLMQ